MSATPTAPRPQGAARAPAAQPAAVAAQQPRAAGFASALRAAAQRGDDAAALAALQALLHWMADSEDDMEQFVARYTAAARARVGTGLAAVLTSRDAAGKHDTTWRNMMTTCEQAIIAIFSAASAAPVEALAFARELVAGGGMTALALRLRTPAVRTPSAAAEALCEMLMYARAEPLLGERVGSAAFLESLLLTLGGMFDNGCSAAACVCLQHVLGAQPGAAALLHGGTSPVLGGAAVPLLLALMGHMQSAATCFAASGALLALLRAGGDGVRDTLAALHHAAVPSLVQVITHEARNSGCAAELDSVRCIGGSGAAAMLLAALCACDGVLRSDEGAHVTDLSALAQMGVASLAGASDGSDDGCVARAVADVLTAAIAASEPVAGIVLGAIRAQDDGEQLLAHIAHASPAVAAAAERWTPARSLLTLRGAERSAARLQDARRNDAARCAAVRTAHVAPLDELLDGLETSLAPDARRRWVALRRARVLALSAAPRTQGVTSTVLLEARIAAAGGFQLGCVETNAAAGQGPHMSEANGLYHFTGVPELVVHAGVPGVSAQGCSALGSAVVTLAGLDARTQADAKGAAFGAALTRRGATGWTPSHSMGANTLQLPLASAFREVLQPVPPAVAAAAALVAVRFAPPTHGPQSVSLFYAEFEGRDQASLRAVPRLVCDLAAALDAAGEAGALVKRALAALYPEAGGGALRMDCVNCHECMAARQCGAMCALPGCGRRHSQAAAAQPGARMRICAHAHLRALHARCILLQGAPGRGLAAPQGGVPGKGMMRGGDLRTSRHRWDKMPQNHELHCPHAISCRMYMTHTDGSLQAARNSAAARRRRRGPQILHRLSERRAGAAQHAAMTYGGASDSLEQAPAHTSGVRAGAEGRCCPHVRAALTNHSLRRLPRSFFVRRRATTCASQPCSATAATTEATTARATATRARAGACGACTGARPCAALTPPAPPARGSAEMSASTLRRLQDAKTLFLNYLETAAFPEGKDSVTQEARRARTRSARL
jgi:hypothetical protein